MLLNAVMENIMWGHRPIYKIDLNNIRQGLDQLGHECSKEN